MSLVEIDEFKNFVQPKQLAYDKYGDLLWLENKVDIENDEYKLRIKNLSKTINQAVVKDFLCWYTKGTAIVKTKIDTKYAYELWEVESDKYSCMFTSQRDYEKIIILENEKYIGLFTEKTNENKDYIVIDKVPFWSEGEGYINGQCRKISVITGNEEIVVTSEDFNVWDIVICGERNLIYYATEIGDISPTNSDIYIMDIEDYTTKVIKTDNKKYVITHIQSIDKEHILVIRSDNKMYGEYQDEYIDKIDIKNGEYQRLNENCLYHLFDDINSDINYGSEFVTNMVSRAEKIYFIATVGESSHLMLGDFNSGKINQVTLSNGKIMEFIISEKEAYIVAMRGLNATEIYRLNLNTGKEMILTNINDYKYELSFPYEQNFCNSDGIAIHGFAMKPINFIEGKKYPTVLFIHGGPNTAYGDCFFHEMQFMTANGYGVIYCNPRGSIGRGAEFADIRCKFGSVDYEDLMEFLDNSIARNQWIDCTKLGVTGGSYGGLMTNWIIGHTKVFNAAISDRSVSNNISDFSTSDIGISCVHDTYGATPWSDFEKLWELSPIKYANNVETPTLFIQGNKDYRCYKDQTIQMFVALKYFGVPTKMILFKGENHSLSMEGKPSHRIRRLEEMLKWFDKYLK